MLENQQQKLKRSEYYKKWYAEHGRVRSKEERKRDYNWIRKNMDKFYTHKKVYLAVKNGELVRPSKCSECSREVKIYAHHPDYSKPLEVLWLCGSCHKFKHIH